MATILSSHQQNTMVSALNVLLLTLNKALPGGRPTITHAYLLLNDAQSCSMLPLSVLVCSSLDVCSKTHSQAF